MVAGDVGRLVTTSRISRSSINYSIDPVELDRLTCDDKWARVALWRAHAKIADIPEHLLDDDASEERIAWLGSKVPQPNRDELISDGKWIRAFVAHGEVSRQ
ncbi:MAG: hypothetical protein OXI01_23200 [Albidovulum sp.]|nr:hypothetical protein [Albidovulum sp.]